MLPHSSDFDTEAEASFLRRTLQQFIDDARKRLNITESSALITISFSANTGFKLQLQARSHARTRRGLGHVELESRELTGDPSDAVDAFVEHIQGLIDNRELMFDSVAAYIAE